MTQSNPECSEIVDENGSSEGIDEIVKLFTCSCGCDFDVTYREPVILITLHGNEYGAGK